LRKKRFLLNKQKSGSRRPTSCIDNVLKDTMEGLESLDKTAWTKEMLYIFCDLCIKANDMGMRPNTHFDKTGRKFLITSFKE
jgi:hypothetical protein